MIIRHWEKRDDCYLTVSISTAHDLMPAQAKYVRGEQGPTVIRMTPLESGRFKLEWLLNTNLKVLRLFHILLYGTPVLILGSMSHIMFLSWKTSW